MRQITALAPAGTGASLTATLTFDERRKSRQRLRLDDGSEAALLLPRGAALAAGAHLLCDDGTVVAVVAAPEALSVVRTPDPLHLARAAYHLGNRHVPLQITPGELRYQHDHVLDAMVAALGLPVEETRAPFEPEPGAYGRQEPHHGPGHHHHE